MQDADENQGSVVLTQEVINSLGHPEDASGETNVASDEPVQGEDLPLYAKEKIGKIQKRHQRDLRRMQDRIDEMQNRLSQPHATQQSSESFTHDPMQGVMTDDEKIHRAVTAALEHKDMQERKAKESEQAQYVHQQYRKLQEDLDRASDKYDDFDEVVTAPHVPFTAAMRDASLMIQNPGEVLYKLGKNPDELARITKLHPLEQAKEINRLSFALMGGNNKMQPEQKPLGQIKNNPVSSRSVNENTSVTELRTRMKQGWK